MEINSFMVLIPNTLRLETKKGLESKVKVSFLTFYNNFQICNKYLENLGVKLIVSRKYECLNNPRSFILILNQSHEENPQYKVNV